MKIKNPAKANQQNLALKLASFLNGCNREKE